MNKIFSGLVQVAIQGERVLRFIDLTEDQAIYEIIGFDDPNVTIIDHRLKALLAIQSLLQTGNLNAFAPIFNKPAVANITQDEMGKLVIELSETSETHPNSILWVAIGIGDSIPVFDYIYEDIRPLDEEKYALLAIYQRLSSEIPASDSIDLSLASSSASSSAWS